MLPFDQSEYFDKNFAKLEGTYAEINRIEFENCTFSNCDFSDASFLSCRFIDCQFEHCNLSNTQFTTSKMNEVSFSDCKILGVDWTQLAWPNLALSSPIAFSNCLLDHSSFYGLELAELRITYCKCHEVDFREANLSHGDFSFSDFSYSQFGKTKLSHANFEEAFHYNIDVFNNKINGARFSRDEALSLLDSLDIEII